MTQPLVTIVVPSFGQAAFLEETLVSLLAQDYPRLELIVVDGGSTDGSVEIIRRYADRLAWWTSEPDSGQADALNKGFARATGELLGWVCSDDTLLQGAVTAAVTALEQEPEALLVYSDAVLTDEHGRELGVLPARPFDVVEMVRTCQNHVVQPGSLFRRQVWELIGPLEVTSHYYFDFEFIIGIALAGPAVRLPRALGTYRLHPESKSTSAVLVKAVDHVRLFDALFARSDLPAELRAVEAEARSRSYLTAGEYYYAALKLREARAAFLRALRLHPRHLDRRSAGLVLRSLLPRSGVAALRRARSRSWPA